MNADIVKQMRLEEADLARKLQAVRDFLRAYGERPAEPTSSPPEPPKPASDGGSREKVDITSFTEQTRRSVLYAMQAMTVSPDLVKTRDLVSFVEAMGHTISGTNKINALGALLARSEDVVGHGKSGWALADREKALVMIQKYLPKENEAPSGNPPEPQKPAGWGVQPPLPAWNNPQSGPAS